jgi:NADH:ubiquinone reductase (H+-translocating)
VIIGAGFAGIHAAKALKKTPVKITLVDRHNYHLFQPLLYQVATGGLSAAEITTPVRSIFRKNQQVRVLMDEMIDILPLQNKVVLAQEEIGYDFLIIATGVQPHYFGHNEFQTCAPSLKSIGEAVDIRGKILTAFEKAEWESDPAEKRALLNFIIVGGGPTGVELVGAIGELAHDTLKSDFRNVNPADARIILVEAGHRILPSFHPKLARYAAKQLAALGVEILTETRVVQIDEKGVTVQQGGRTEAVAAKTIVWTAGVRAAATADILKKQFAAETDPVRRLLVNEYCQLPQHSNIYIIGDLAAQQGRDGNILPGVAPVAMQQGHYVGQHIRSQLAGKNHRPFRYYSKGNLAVIGRSHAISHIGIFKNTGFFAWLLWLFVHLMYLVGFRNRLLVLIQWAWSYVTKNKGSRLITTCTESENAHRQYSSEI